MRAGRVGAATLIGGMLVVYAATPSTSEAQPVRQTVGLGMLEVSGADTSASPNDADPWVSSGGTDTWVSSGAGTSASPNDADAWVSPGGAALRSALIPGAGQLALGQRRGWAYLGIEALGWVVYLDRRRSGGALREEYRDFAWEEARLQSGARVDGDFDYYETMSQWDRSGAFDADPSLAGVQPEVDATRYNGLVWTRALGIFSADPAAGPGDPRYDAALEYYVERAYGDDFLWDWTGDPGARSTYAGIIEASDDRFRQARNAVGLVIANHLVSAVDAFVAARSRVRLESRIVPGPMGRGLTFAASLRTGSR